QRPGIAGFYIYDEVWGEGEDQVLLLSVRCLRADISGCRLVDVPFSFLSGSVTNSHNEIDLMNSTSRFMLYRLPVVLYAGLIFFLSSGPVPSTELENIPDYYLHFCEFGLFYIAMFWAIHEGFRPLPGRGSYWLPAILTILFGISDEFHQIFV